MRIVFLGGTRFIGIRAVRLAAERGHSVTVFHRGIHKSALPQEVEEVIVDRNHSSALSSALRKANAEVVVDTFAMTEEQTRKTIDGLKGHTSHVVVLSSQDVYAQFGRLNGHPASTIEELVSETSPLTVRFPFKGLADHEGGSEYDKKDVEALYANSTRNDLFESVAVLRLPAVFGSGDYQRRFGPIVDRLDSGVRHFPCQDQASWRWTHGHVTNMAQAILLSAEKRIGGFNVFNVGEEHPPTMRERVDRIAQLMGKSVEWMETIDLAQELSLLGKMPNDFVVTTERIRSLLEYREILGEDDCYVDLIEWLRRSRNDGFTRPS
jgi:nucleoside-diphosphate-sugar epimerase